MSGIGGSMRVSIDHLVKPGETGVQESDLLERMADGACCEDPSTKHILLVSLGSFCGTKLSFKKIGRGAETLPFDWIRTRFDGVLEFLRSDFEGFFDFVTRQEVPGTDYMVLYRDYLHSFWHDDPTDPAMREKYHRRMERFSMIDGHTSSVLFVRAAVTHEEVARAPELVSELTSRFGRHASLLLIVDFQSMAPGACLIAGHDNLMIYHLGEDAHHDQDGAPYCTPVLCGLEWVAGKPIQAMQFPSLDKVVACTDETFVGLMGMGGLRSFEELSEAEAVEQELEEIKAFDLLRHRPLLAPEKMQTVSGSDSQIVLVSLGCNGLVQCNLTSLGYGSEPLPFDSVCVSLDGLLAFLTVGFQEFMKYYRKRAWQCGDASGMVYRSPSHSFWHENPELEETKVDYKTRIGRFTRLGTSISSGQTLLFVRTVATTEEIPRAHELLSALRASFGNQVCLLLIVEGQDSPSSAYCVEGFEDLLVYYLSREGATEYAASLHKDAIETAIAWVEGEVLEASEVNSLSALRSIAEETFLGLIGLGGLYAFEGIRPALSGQPKATVIVSTDDSRDQ